MEDLCTVCDIHKKRRRSVTFDNWWEGRDTIFEFLDLRSKFISKVGRISIVCLKKNRSKDGLSERGGGEMVKKISNSLPFLSLFLHAKSNIQLMYGIRKGRVWVEPATWTKEVGAYEGKHDHLHHFSCLIHISKCPLLVDDEFMISRISRDVRKLAQTPDIRKKNVVFSKEL